MFLIFSFVQNWSIDIAASTPRYSAPIFYNMEDLIEWLETTDAETFQGGRYHNCLLSFRSRGKFFLPSVSNPDLVLRRIEVLPTHSSRGLIHDGMMSLLIVYYDADLNRQLTILVNEINPIRIDAYIADGILGYMREVRPSRSETDVIMERETKMKDQNTGELVSRRISYSLRDLLDSPTNPIASAIFIVDGFELSVTFHDQSLFDNLTWDIVPITYRPQLPAEYSPQLPVEALEYRTIRFTIGNMVYAIDGTPHTNDVAPFIDPAYNRTMIPLRAVSEALGAEVEWIAATRTVLIATNTGEHQLTVDVPLPDGMGVPVLLDNRVLVPIRYVAEILGATTRWDGTNSAVYIYM